MGPQSFARKIVITASLSAAIMVLVLNAPGADGASQSPAGLRSSAGSETTIPEAMSLAIVGSGALLLAGRLRKRRRA